MKRTRNSAKRLAGHISVIGMFLILVIGLLLENCLETCKQNLPGPEPLEDVKTKSTVQLPSRTQEALEDTYSSHNKELSIPSTSVDLSVGERQEKRVQEQTVSSGQKEVSSITATPSYLSLPPIVKSKGKEKPMLVSPSDEEQQSSEARPLGQVLHAVQRGVSEQKVVKEQLLEAKEKQLLSKVFISQGRYRIRFYREAGIWKARVKDVKYTTKYKYNLLARLGSGKELAESIQQLVGMEPTTRLLYVVLRDKEEQGYVYIGGVKGGMKGQNQGGGKEKIAKEKNKINSKPQANQLIGGGRKKEEDEEKKKAVPVTKRITRSHAEGSQQKTIQPKGESTTLSFKAPTAIEMSQLLKKAQKGDRAAKASLIKFPWKKYLDSFDTTEEKNKAEEFFNEAIKWYKEAAKKDNRPAQQALIELRNEGLYSNLDKEAMSWYKQAVGAAIEGSKLDFETFQKRARDRFEESRAGVKRKKKKRIVQEGEPTWVPPMRVSDLIVMDLDAAKVPYSIEWGGNYISPKDANADTIFGPLFDMHNTRKYEDAIMTIDPSGKGRDETGYCVAKRCGNYYFIIDVGGLAGAYAGKDSVEEDSKASVGNNPKVLEELVSIALEHNVSRVIVENNNDKSIADLLERKFSELKSKEKSGQKLISKVLKFVSIHQKQNKEKKIIRTLQPLLMEHRLIIDRKALKKDFNSEPKKDLYYKFFYQLMSIVKNQPPSKQYFDNGKPMHDDRVDAVADAIYYLQERKNQLDKVKADLAEFKSNAIAGEISSQLELGRIYKDGMGVEENYEEAVKWYKMVAYNDDADNKNRAEAMFNLAQVYSYQNNWMKIEKEKKEKEKGKENEDTSLEEVIKLYKDAAEMDHAGAKYELGRLYQKGIIQEKEEEKEKGKETGNLSFKKALELFKAAANKNHIKAAYKLGKIYEKGSLEVTPNYKEAARWYQRAAIKEDVKSQLHLADIYYNGKGISKNYSMAKRFYIGPAKYGYLEAQVVLGGMYYEGKGIKQNYRKAFKWYQEAANRGDKIAEYNLGRMYENGWGVNRKDESLALQWYRAAAEQGHVEAQFELGKMYENARKYEEAREWYEKAVEQDYIEAQFKLGELYRQGLGMDIKDEVEAVGFYEKAANQGHAEANIQLSLMYAFGEGVNKDADKAREYYREGTILKNKSPKIEVKEAN